MGRYGFLGCICQICEDLGSRGLSCWNASLCGFHPTPSHPQIPDQDNARRAKPGEPFTFTGEHLKYFYSNFSHFTSQWMRRRLDGGRWRLMWCMRISKCRFSSLALYSTPLPFSEDERSLLDRCLVAGRSSEPFTWRRSETGSMQSPSPRRLAANTGSLSISTGWR